MAVLRINTEAVAVACLNQISADDGLRTSEGGVCNSKADARFKSVKDDVADNRVVGSLLDRDAVYGTGDSVLGDHVAVAGGDEDSSSLNDPIPAHPVTVAFLNYHCGGIAGELVSFDQ